MRTIPHRELRNESSRVLARVAKGESVIVTNHGEVAAIIVPPTARELDRLAAAGRLRRARERRPSLRDISRAAGLSRREVLEDIRGDR